MPAERNFRELTADETGPVFDPAGFGFQTTDELSPLDEIVGQPRAVRAMDLGLGVRQPGYHIFLSGLSGTGKMEMARRTLAARARQEAPPPDWVYVNNFNEAEQPIAISLKAGQGKQLKRDMAGLVTRLLEELPKAFQREDFSREKDRLRRQYKQQGEAIFGELAAMAKERNVAVQQLPGGEIVFLPLHEGKPISPEEAQKLPPDELEQIDRRQQELLEATESIALRQQEVERQLNNDVRNVERTFAARVIEPLLGEIGARYDNEKVQRWLERLKTHFIKNLDRFRRRADRIQQIDPVFGEPFLADIQERFFEYQVNLLVDNDELKQAPLVIESAPNYRNLFGTVDRVVDRFGRVVTNFTRIKSGSLLRANGGYLVINLEDALTEPFVWKELKRSIRSGAAEIEVYDPFALFTISSLKPEPIPLNVKLVVLGHPLLYHLLYLYDDDFREMFKVKADFDTEIGLDSSAARVYGQLVRKLRDTEQIPPFDAPAVGELLRAGARMASDRRKLTAEFRRLVDLIREAAYWAGLDKATFVSAPHVRQALKEQVYRADLIAARIRDLVADGTLLIGLEDPEVGRINALTVADLGDYAFGWPVRLTASAGVGSTGIINIERESRLSGRTFDKGMLILEGYLRNQYAGEHPLALSASLAMEQSYGGVDGDSASVAEIICLLSVISGVPLRQDIAVTGSVNQWGQVQAIGGANEKIEGFFDVCRQHGLSGRQGVCLPAANVQHLILRHDVVEAVSAGQFHIWPIKTVDESLELMTGIEAGDTQCEGTLHFRVARRLEQMAAALKKQRAVPAERGLLPLERPPVVPADPRPPLPGRDGLKGR